jgi:hypothetical protein
MLPQKFWRVGSALEVNDRLHSAAAFCDAARRPCTVFQKPFDTFYGSRLSKKSEVSTLTPSAAALYLSPHMLERLEENVGEEARSLSLIAGLD